MSRALNSFVVFVMIVSVLAGCRAMTGNTAGEDIDDATITASVKSKLVAKKASNLTGVDVDSNRGTVYLNGASPRRSA